MKVRETVKILYITTVGCTMVFFKDFIRSLVQEGHRVDIATNEKDWEVPEFYRELGCKIHPISTSRSPLDKGNLRAIKEVRQLVEAEKYDIVHCHTPNASVVTRLACRGLRKKSGLKVFYTAHGFHFYKGAPKLNWMVYYPIEKICSYFTDKLITINREDYALAKAKFHAKEVHYVPGVGIDLSRFENVQVDRAAKRREIGVPEDCFLLLSIGELNENKNHQVIIKAMAQLNDPNVHYAIAGLGDKRDDLLALAKSLGVDTQVHLLGFRKDIPELNCAADAFCFPSHREGLGMASIEAMACGLPLLTSNIHGINDYSIDGTTGFKFSPLDVDGFALGIRKLKSDDALRRSMGQYNRSQPNRYGIEESSRCMTKIYGV